MSVRGSFAVLIGMLLLFTSVSVLAGSCDTALLIVDMQANGLGAERVVNMFSQPILDSVEIIVERVRATEIPIIYTSHISTSMVDPETIPFPASITPRDADRILVRTDHPPMNDALIALMEEEGITRLIICGLYSTHCVDIAVCNASGLGYDVIVIKEGHGDFPENLTQANARQYQWTRLPNVAVVRSAHLDLDSLETP
ncbi:isochorismatase family cysteine hydrolase [Candidatus Bipolaricaulota bacterium]